MKYHLPGRCLAVEHRLLQAWQQRQLGVNGMIGFRFQSTTIHTTDTRSSTHNALNHTTNHEVMRIRQQAPARWHELHRRWLITELPDPRRPLERQRSTTTRADSRPALDGKPTFLSAARDKFVSVFLPKGYPHSVTANYLPFSQWNFLSAICGTTVGVLSTQALLRALGMGASGAIPVAATLNWVIKDGLGLLGGVIYTSVFSGRFDSEPKRYRFKAALALQAASLCELLTPLMPGYFLVTASLSNIGKNIAWLTLSGTRAQMHQSLCVRDNLGDITAKAGSQNTAAGLVGTGLGVACAAVVGDSFEMSLLASLPLSMLSLYGVYRSNCTVWSRSLNIQRCERLFSSYLHARSSGLSLSFPNGMPPTDAVGPASPPPSALHSLPPPSKEELLGPEEVSQHEEFIRQYRSVFRVPLHVNAPVTATTTSTTAPGWMESTLRDTFQQKHLCQEERYYLAARSSDHAGNNPEAAVYLWMDIRAKAPDVLAGMLHACLLRQELEGSAAKGDVPADSRQTWLHATIRTTHEETRRIFPGLRRAMQAAGWNVQDLLLEDEHVHRRVQVDTHKQQFGEE